MSEERREGSRFTYSTDAYEVLSHPLRRRILSELTQQDNPVSLDTLAEAIARAPMPDVDGLRDATTDTEAVATSLHHLHVPKLEDAGWIEYNDEDGTIRYQSHVAQIRADLQDASAELASLLAALDERTTGNSAHEDDEHPPPDEHETLTRAFELGYFEVPRRATLTEIADELRISDVEASERLRRETVSMLRDQP